MKRFRSFLTISVLLLAECSHYAVVKKTNPVLHAGTAAGQSIASIGQQLERQPREALPQLLGAAADLANNLKSRPADAVALQEYNFAVARIFTAIEQAQKAGTAPPPEPAEVRRHRRPRAAAALRS